MNDGSGKFPDTNPFQLPSDRRGRALAVSGNTSMVAYTGPEDQAGGAGFSVNDLIRTILKWRWLIVGITAACVMAAVIISLMITPTYQGSVTLEINRESTRILANNTDAEPERGQDLDFVATQVGLLRSRSLAERVARTLNLGSNEGFAPQEGGSRADREGAAVGMLRGGLGVVPERNTRLVRITFDHTNPGEVARVANAFADNFIESNLERKYEANSYARDFLQKRLATTKAALEKSERQAVAYASANGILQLGGGGDRAGSGETSLDAASLVQLNQSLSDARNERILAEQRYNQSEGKRSSEVVNNSTIQSLNGQRATLEAEYQEKLGIYQPEFPQMVQLRSRLAAINRSIAQQSSAVTGAMSGSLRSDYQAAIARENALQARVASLRSSVMGLRERSIDLTILQREVDTNRSLYDALLERYKAIGVAGGVGTNLISIVDRAEVPGGPIAPNLPVNVLIGLALGLLLGFGAAFAIEFIDDTIKNPEDLTNKLKVTPLGVIPRGGKDRTLIETLADPRAPVTEAYHSVRTALQFASDHGVPKSLLVTSTRAAEGKSSTSMALAQNFARLGATVLLIDSDLRKPSFRAPSSASEGLSNLLAGATNVRECIHKTDFERLFLLPSGPIPPNPAELLSTDRFRKILDEVGAWFDYVVVDAPPVLGLADAPLLSSVCEGTLMVFEASKIRRGVALNAVNRLRGADARLLGGVLTKYNAKMSGYGYGYAYVDESYAYGVGEERQRQIELIA